MAIDKSLGVLVGIVGQLGLSRRHAYTVDLIKYEQTEVLCKGKSCNILGCFWKSEIGGILSSDQIVNTC